MKYKDLKTGADAELKDSVLYLPGTSGKIDLRQDFSFFLKQGMHKGAYRQAMFLLYNVDWRKVKKIKGYSLGGAVALILGQWREVEVETFGAFRPFWIGKKLKDLKATNYIHRWDLIPRLFWFRKFYGKIVYVGKFSLNFKKNHLSYPELKEF